MEKDKEIVTPEEVTSSLKNSKRRGQNSPDSLWNLLSEEDKKLTEEKSYNIFLQVGKEKIKIGDLNPPYSLWAVSKKGLEDIKAKNIFQEGVKRLVFFEIMNNGGNRNHVGKTILQHIIEHPKVAKKMFLLKEMEGSKKECKNFILQLSKNLQIELAQVTKETEELSQKLVETGKADNIKEAIGAHLYNILTEKQPDAFGEMFERILKDNMKQGEIEDFFTLSIQDDFTMEQRGLLPQIYMERKFRQLTSIEEVK